MNKKLPFRTEVTCGASALSAEDMALINRLNDNDITPEILRKGIEHPNELVVWLTALWVSSASTHMRPRRLWESEFYNAAVDLLDLALQQADKEDCVWTPILDALAQNYCWERVCANLQDRSQAIANLPPTPQERLHGIVHWLQTKPDQKDIERLLKFSAPVVREVVAQHAPELPDWLVDRLLNSAKAGFTLLKNPAATESVRQKIALWICESWEKARERADTIDYTKLCHDIENEAGLLEALAPGLNKAFLSEIMQRVRSVVYESKGGHRLYPIYAAGMRALLSDPDVTPEDLKTALTSSDVAMKARVVVHPKTPLDYILSALKDEMYGRKVAEAALEVAGEEIREEILFFMVDLFGYPFTKTIIKHPAATPRVWHKILEEHPSAQNFLAFAESERARRDPYIRARLLKSTNAEVISLLLGDKVPDEFPALFERLVEKDPDAAVNTVLNKGVVPEGVKLNPAVVTKLLTRTTGDTRTLAITRLIPYMAPADLSQPTPPSNKRKRNRSG